MIRSESNGIGLILLESLVGHTPGETLVDFLNDLPECLNFRRCLMETLPTQWQAALGYNQLSLRTVPAKVTVLVLEDEPILVGER